MNSQSLVRHTAVKRGCDIDEEGFVLVEQVFGLLEFQHLTMSCVMKMVHEDREGRFELATRDRDNYIRAVQGHTIGLNVTYSSTHPVIMVHGTNDAGWSTINYDGVRVIGRDHIHAVDRLSFHCLHVTSTILVYFNVEKMTKTGIDIYLSPNKYEIYSLISTVLMYIIIPRQRRSYIDFALFGQSFSRHSSDRYEIIRHEIE
jgi:RNA:NAD 2'-phosphotransferase (TPT1/KptA family)